MFFRKERDKFQQYKADVNAELGGDGPSLSLPQLPGYEDPGDDDPDSEYGTPEWGSGPGDDAPDWGSDGGDIEGAAGPEGDAPEEGGAAPEPPGD